MQKFVFLFLLAFVSLFEKVNAQVLDTVVICNGDSVNIYNLWQTQTGNYLDPITGNITTLIVNPTPTVTGNFILNGKCMIISSHVVPLSVSPK